MACSPGSSCCEDCASSIPDDQSSRDEIVRGARDLVNQAEQAVEEGGQCGGYGVLQDATEFVFGDGQGADSDELCERQRRQLANLRLTLTQLESLLADANATSDRVVVLIDAIDSSATGLIAEGELSSWSKLARVYARNVGTAVGTVVGGALDAAAEGVAGVARGIGLGWLIVAAAVAVVWLNPSLLRRS